MLKSIKNPDYIRQIAISLNLFGLAFSLWIAIVGIPGIDVKVTTRGERTVTSGWFPSPIALLPGAILAGIAYSLYKKRHSLQC